MKLIFTLTTALLFSVSMLAGPSRSTLSISSYSSVPVTVTIDSRSYGQTNSKEVIIGNISPGYHQVKVYKESGGRWPANRKQLIYSHNVFIRQGFHTDIAINRFGKAFIDERKIVPGYYDETCDDGYNDDHFRRPMDATSFGQFKQTISNGSFENTKLIMAKQTISQHYFTATQIKEIVELFSFESNKLEIAKYAFDRCSEKNNYFLVNDAFTFSSSKEELMKYTANSR